MKDYVFDSFQEAAKFSADFCTSNKVTARVIRNGDGRWKVIPDNEHQPTELKKKKGQEPSDARRTRARAEHFHIDQRIQAALSEAGVKISHGPPDYFIGDGVSWQAEVGRQFNNGRVRSAKQELRNALDDKIQLHAKTIRVKERIEILNELRRALRCSDDVMIKSTRILLVARLTSRSFERISELLEDIQ